MKIYTKTGDKGQTSLIGGTRVLKSHERIECYGTVDELNSYLGLIASHALSGNLNNMLAKVQNDLFVIGSELASDPERSETAIPHIEISDIEALELSIDEMNEVLPPLKFFVLPGGHPLAAYCHIARCVCRRAERLTVFLADKSFVEPLVITYLNRLSDFLFILARKVCADNNAKEVKWIPVNKK